MSEHSVGLQIALGSDAVPHCIHVTSTIEKGRLLASSVISLSLQQSVCQILNCFYLSASQSIC